MRPPYPSLIAAQIAPPVRKWTQRDKITIFSIMGHLFKVGPSGSRGNVYRVALKFGKIILSNKQAKSAIVHREHS